MKRSSEYGQWATTVRRAIEFRNSLLFCARQRFDRALRPKTKDGMTIDYPDAFYHITTDDLVRAMVAAQPPRIVNDTDMGNNAAVEGE